MPAVVERADFPNLAILLVDNGSADGPVGRVAGRFPEVKGIALSENRGVTGGNRVGLRASSSESEQIALLTSDTQPESNKLVALVHDLEAHSEVGFCASKMLQPMIHRPLMRRRSYLGLR